jgi:hypothetical protein
MDQRHPTRPYEDRDQRVESDRVSRAALLRTRLCLTHAGLYDSIHFWLAEIPNNT